LDQSQTEEKEEEIDGDDDGDAVAPVPTTSPVSVEAMGEWFTERYCFFPAEGSISLA
jgi:hypothetical protein